MLGDGVEPGEEGQALVEDLGHGVACAGFPGELEREQGSHGGPGGDHLGTRQPHLGHHLVEADLGERGHEQEQPAHVGAELPGAEVKSAALIPATAAGAGGKSPPRTRRPSGQRRERLAGFGAAKLRADDEAAATPTALRGSPR